MTALTFCQWVVFSGSSEIFTLPKDEKDVGQWASLEVSGSDISAGYVVFTEGRFVHFQRLTVLFVFIYIGLPVEHCNISFALL